MFLRIKKRYYDQIKSGYKAVEYRSMKPYYIRRFENKNIQRVIFHYQKKIYLLTEVQKIETIECPEHIKNLGIEFTPLVYAIHLANPVELPSFDLAKMAYFSK